jgi:hypothetical protein
MPSVSKIALGLALALLVSAPGLSQETQNPVDAKSDEPITEFQSPGEVDNANPKSKSETKKSTVGRHRFEPSASREYLIERARKESEARAELLQRYQASGVDYAHPTFDSMIMHPYYVQRHPRQLRNPGHPIFGYPLPRSWFYVQPIMAW